MSLCMCHKGCSCFLVCVSSIYDWFLVLVTHVKVLTAVDAEIKVPSVENPELINALPLKPGVDQNIATRALSAARNFFLVWMVHSPSFIIIFKSVWHLPHLTSTIDNVTAGGASTSNLRHAWTAMWRCSCRWRSPWWTRSWCRCRPSSSSQMWTRPWAPSSRTSLRGTRGASLTERMMPHTSSMLCPPTSPLRVSFGQILYVSHLVPLPALDNVFLLMNSQM